MAKFPAESKKKCTEKCMLFRCPSHYLYYSRRTSCFQLAADDIGLEEAPHPLILTLMP